MKTRNNVQKAATKTLAVIISLVLISFTVKAQDFWKNVLSNNSFNQIAMVMVDNTESSVNESNSASASIADMFAEYLVEESDEVLDVEDWMVNENNFYRNLDIETEAEGNLELEGWMMNEDVFNTVTEALQAEPEESMELENWMTTEKIFGVRTMLIVQEQDAKLGLEPWMVDKNVWNF